MKRTFLGLWAVLAVTVLPAARVVADDITFASHGEIISVLEQQNLRLAELKAALQNNAANGTRLGESGYGAGCGNGCTSGCCDSCCDSCCGCDPCCRPAGIIVGAEATFLKPHSAHGIRGAGGNAIEYDYEIAPRLSVGYQGSDGLGFRVRYWEFDHEQQVAGIAPGTTDTIDIDTYIIDLEFIDSMSLGCCWDASYFAGFRYLEFDQERVLLDAAGGVIFGNQYESSSIGLTVGGELRRGIGCGLAGYFNARASVLMGDEVQSIDFGGGWFPVDRELDNIYYIWEAQTGVQWTRELAMGGYLFARAGLEVQFWENIASGTVIPIVSEAEDIGFGGFSCSAGIIR